MGMMDDAQTDMSSMRERYDDLMERKQTTGLSDEEDMELDRLRKNFE